jgi:siderophore synthetase component
MQLLTLHKTQQRVIKQLLEAALFENLLEYEISSINSNIGNITVFGSTATFHCSGKRSSFNRIRLNDQPIYTLDNDFKDPRVASLMEILEQVPGDSKKKSDLWRELRQTVLLGDWNEENLTHKPRRHLPYEELESAIIEGHPYHPCFKARTGFTLEDHEKYGPEAGNVFQLYWIAVKRKDVKTSFPSKEHEFWRDEIGEETLQNLLAQLTGYGSSISTYSLMPVHPWQWETKIKQIAETMEERTIIPLGFAGDYYRATQSVRTLWNANDPKKAHIKLPLNMVNTSSLRTMEAHSVCTAPEISKWLQKIWECDTYLQKRMVFLEEFAGTIALETHPALNGHLAAIWRKSVNSILDKGENAIPFNSLSLNEMDGNPFIHVWIMEYGLENWLKQLIETSVIPVWHLLVVHGIGLEAHAQNMILIHENGWPTKMAIRDFHESLEYVDSYLKDVSIKPNFDDLHPDYPNAKEDEFYWMSSVEGLRELVMDTLFVFHLSDLSYLMDKRYGYSENNFWKLVKGLIEEHVSHFPDCKRRMEVLQPGGEQIYTESLFTKKLTKEKEEYHHLVPNSLYHGMEL